MNFNHYFTNDEVADTLKGWSSEYPHLAQVTELGKSFEGSPIWLLTLTNQETGADVMKPALWIDANIHATELAGTTTALYIAQNLISGYGNDERITRLLDQMVFYIMPRVNPDGSALAMADCPRYIRSGVRPYPWLDKEEGLHPQDLDGDGKILQMRIADPNGDWKISSLEPRLMEKRQPDDHGGQYYRLLAEGLIEDFDGYLIKRARPVEGLDFNRNFPFDWKPEAEQVGAGPYPASEPEIKAMVDFITRHPNINVAITYHTFSAALLRPYSTKSDDEMEVSDLWVYKKMGEIGKVHTGYRAVSTYHDFRSHPHEMTTGAFDDWLYDHLGAFTFTVELWDLPTRAGIEDRKLVDWFQDHPHEHDLKILQWAEANAGAEVFVEWHPFNHPQLGQVELGGWNMMYTWRNPPHVLMEAEAARHFPFMLSLADMLPVLSIHTLETTPLGNDTYRINLVVENTGFLPSYTSEQGKKRRSARPVRAEIVLPGCAELVSGKRRREIGHLEGRSNKLAVVTLWSSGETDNRARAEWVVRVPGEAGPEGCQVVIKVLSDRAGSIERIVPIKS